MKGIIKKAETLVGKGKINFKEMSHLELKKVLKENIDALSNIGSDPTGGMTRLLYSDSWLEAQKYVQKQLEEEGLTTSFDEIGNLFGRVEGTKYPEETIMSGSHIDTVTNGGTLDGQYGVISSYLAVRYLLETYGKPLRSLEVVSLAEEEGSRFPTVFWGSKNFVKLAKRSDVEEIADPNGTKFVDEMHRQGFDFRDETTPLREDIRSFVEIHIEQGSVLEKENLQVGVVNNIVGQRRYTVTLKGEANHAGTTPMNYRKDAVYGFAKISSKTIDRAYEVGDPLVATFGKVDPKPNTVNVVPGEVSFTLDCRHTDEKELKNFTTEFETLVKNVSDELGLEVEINLWMDEVPIPMDEKVVGKIKDAAEAQKVNYKIMHSGAGHDSQVIAPYYPTAMIFVPSINGISHSPEEHTDLDDLVVGVQVLARALFELAYKD